jgi:sulfate adenylyltransferase subunit 1 (EFTu-like GTPase family)
MFMKRDKRVFVQTVVRPKRQDHDFRGYREIMVNKSGDAVTVLPSDGIQSE